jgi:hypothetical protein
MVGHFSFINNLNFKTMNFNFQGTSVVPFSESANTNVKAKRPFIEANTEEVSLSFLKKQMYCAKLFKRWRSNYIPSRIY